MSMQLDTIVVNNFKSHIKTHMFLYICQSCIKGHVSLYIYTFISYRVNDKWVSMITKN